ncbi:hypothetical protein [Tenacibaculum amylolyticum]|uniref:hypothetical protein n=1 Tax=Tenacibaculum amylolyticum TaxID=104269 RepID=UPI003893C328
MINLNEYIGSIATSLTEARMISDLKSLEIAEKFAKHDLLKHFSIPRFRAQNIELTIPVAIGELETQYETAHQPIDNIEFSAQTYSILKDVAQRTSFDRKTSLRLKAAINNEVESLEKTIKATDDETKALQMYSERITEQFLAISGEKIEVPVLTKRITQSLASQIKPKQPVKQEPKVIVESYKLQEIKPENLIQIKMTLNEEGMEWHTSEDDNGNVSSKLLPE